mgnify:CR=1 FL=1
MVYDMKSVTKKLLTTMAALAIMAGIFMETGMPARADEGGQTGVITITVDIPTSVPAGGDIKQSHDDIVRSLNINRKNVGTDKNFGVWICWISCAEEREGYDYEYKGKGWYEVASGTFDPNGEYALCIYAFGPTWKSSDKFVITVNGSGVEWRDPTFAYAIFDVSLTGGGNTSGGSGTPEVSSSSEVAGASEEVFPSEEAPVEVHEHFYSWVTVQEASTEQDGVEEYRCGCGAVAGRNVIPASSVVVNGLSDVIKNAPQNGVLQFDSGRMYTLSDYMIKKLSERSDVTTIITFKYEGKDYKMTIPAGVDYSALFADETNFYGYFYFAEAVGAVIEEC